VTAFEPAEYVIVPRNVSISRTNVPSWSAKSATVSVPFSVTSTLAPHASLRYASGNVTSSSSIANVTGASAAETGASTATDSTTAPSTRSRFFHPPLSRVRPCYHFVAIDSSPRYAGTSTSSTPAAGKPGSRPVRANAMSEQSG
jgi:hypothetical protein